MNKIEIGLAVAFVINMGAAAFWASRQATILEQTRDMVIKLDDHVSDVHMTNLQRDMEDMEKLIEALEVRAAGTDITIFVIEDFLSGSVPTYDEIIFLNQRIDHLESVMWFD